MCSLARLTVIIDGKETILRATDTCYIGPNERREIINRGNGSCDDFGCGWRHRPK